MSGEVDNERWAGLRRAVPSLTGDYLILIALYGVFRAAFPPIREHLYWQTQFVEVVGLPASVDPAFIVLLFIVAAALFRRKRVARWLLTILLSLDLLTNMAGFGLLVDLHASGRRLGVTAVDVGFSIANTVLLAGWLAVLFWARGEFCARVQPGSIRRAALTLAGGLTVSFTAAYLLSMASGTHGRKEHAAWALHRLLGSTDPFRDGPGGQEPPLTGLVASLLAACALFAALLVLLRSQRTAAALAAADEWRIRGLLAAAGERDSLGYFATRRDKSVVFSASGKAAVTYRVVGGVSLASGDPIGDPDAWPPAIAAWLRAAREYAWVPAVVGASEQGAQAYARAGLRVLQLGDEAVLAVSEFSLEGREMRGVRQAVGRLARAGYQVRVRRHTEIGPDEMARIIARAEEWRDTETERGFSMALGRLGDPADGRCVMVEAIAPGGGEAAILSFAPWGERGLSLDLMRRDRDADNGLMEFMVSRLVEAAPALGVTHISLNFAMFRSVIEEGSRIGAGPVLRLSRAVLLFLSRWWQIESLYRANVKYRPRWVPRFLCYEEARDITRVGLASAVAEGLLTVPSLTALLHRGEGRPEPRADPPLPVPEPTPGGAAAAPRRLPEQVAQRVATMEKMRAAGTDPYPVLGPVTHSCAQIAADHGELPPDRRTGDAVRIAGRVLLARDLGGICFAVLRDDTGDIQLMLERGAELSRWRSTVDLGDQVVVTGEVATSRRGELSVLVHGWTMAAKCLRPLPGKHTGLTDPQARVRARYLDLAVNPAARRILSVRSAAVRALRETLHARGFLEVETPILQPVHGGANARPFTTRSNAYGIGLHLRIAPELYLKRLCVGGVGKVFELGRTFRNEGADATHNPEFTMLEAYQAYADYRTMQTLARQLIQQAAIAAYGAPVLRRAGPDGSVSEVDISGEWRETTVNEAVSAALGATVTAGTGRAELAAHAEAAGVPYPPGASRGEILLELYERLVEHATVEPTFYLDFPTDVAPLTRAHREDDRLAERWDLVAFGVEIGTAYTELTDPVEQRRRLTAQSLRAAGGDPEAMELDEDFLLALEYAMPPTGGLGLGVDRLVMLLTGLPIRDTLPFPLVRPAGRSQPAQPAQPARSARSARSAQSAMSRSTTSAP